MRNYIILNIPYKDKTSYTMQSKELLEMLSKNDIDISNIIILPEDVKISTLQLPIKNENLVDK